MTDQIAYQEYIQRRYNAFCKTVIRCAALDKILKLKRQWERQVSLDYLMNEKFVQFAASEPDEEYPFTVCGQTVLLCNAALADAISVLPEQTREEILRYYFLRQPQLQSKFLPRCQNPQFCGFAPRGKLVGECLPQTLLWRLAPQKYFRPAGHFFARTAPEIPNRPAYFL